MYNIAVCCVRTPTMIASVLSQQINNPYPFQSIISYIATSIYRINLRLFPSNTRNTTTNTFMGFHICAASKLPPTFFAILLSLEYYRIINLRVPHLPHVVLSTFFKKLNVHCFYSVNIPYTLYTDYKIQKICNITPTHKDTSLQGAEYTAL